MIACRTTSDLCIRVEDNGLYVQRVPGFVYFMASSRVQLKL